MNAQTYDASWDGADEFQHSASLVLSDDGHFTLCEGATSWGGSYAHAATGRWIRAQNVLRFEVEDASPGCMFGLGSHPSAGIEGDVITTYDGRIFHRVAET